MQGEGAGDGNLYDAGDDDGPNKVAKGDALYDTGDDGTGDAAPPQKAPARKPTEALYDTGDDGTGDAAPPQKAPARKPTEALYDTGDDGGAAPAQRIAPPVAQLSRSNGHALYNKGPRSVLFCTMSGHFDFVQTF